MTSPKLALALICTVFTSMLTSAAADDVLIQVDNAKVFVNGSEIDSMDVIRTIVANAPPKTVIAFEADHRTRWHRIEEIMTILHQRPGSLIIKFRTVPNLNDRASTGSRSAG